MSFQSSFWYGKGKTFCVSKRFGLNFICNNIKGNILYRFFYFLKLFLKTFLIVIFILQLLLHSCVFYFSLILKLNKNFTSFMFRSCNPFQLVNFFRYVHFKSYNDLFLLFSFGYFLVQILIGLFWLVLNVRIQKMACSLSKIFAFFRKFTPSTYFSCYI